MLDRASMEVVCADCGCVQGLHSFTAAPGEHSHPMGGASARAARIAAIAMAYELPSHVVREAIRIARLLEGYKRGAALAVKLAAMLHGIRVDLRRLRPYRALRKLYQEGTLDRPVAKRLDTAERYLEEFTAKLRARGVNVDLERAKRVMAMLKRGKPRSIAAAALYLTTGLTQKEITTITGVSRYTISEIISKNLKTKKAKFQKFKNIRI